jgi:hypothetical protein
MLVMLPEQALPAQKKDEKKPPTEVEGFKYLT